MPNEAKVSLIIQIKNLAKKELDSFRQSLKNLGAEAKELLSSRLTQALSLGAIAIGLRKAFQATDELEQSQRTLAATSQLTGASLEELFGISNRLREAFSLDDDQANRLTETITKLTVSAGRFNQTQEAAAAFLELGAARGFSVAETMDALQAAQFGVYRGAQRLLGQNVEDLFQKQARAIGVSVGEMTQAEKAQALLDAAIKAGETARGSYAAWLDTAAGKQHLLNLRINDAQVAFGTALKPLRLLALEGLGFLAQKLREFVGGIQAWGLELGFFWDRVVARVKGTAGVVVLSFGEMLNSTAAIVQEWGGKIVGLLNPIMKAIGQPLIDWVASVTDKAGDAMVITGSRLVEQSREMLAAIAQAREDALAELGGEFVTGPNVPPPGSTGGSGRVKPPSEDPLRDVKRRQKEMEALRVAYRDGKIGLVDYAGALDTIRTQAQWVAEETATGTELWAGYQAIIDATGGAISGVSEEFFKLTDAQRESEDQWDAITNTAINWREVMKDISMNTLQEFAGVIEQTFAAIVDSSAKAGQAFKVAMLNAIAAIVRALGQMLLVKAGENIAKAIEFPLQAGRFLAAAAKYAGVAALAFAVAGGLGGAAANTGGGGGGGGGGASASAAAARDSIDRGPGTITVVGGLLDMTDPRQADALAKAIEDLTGRKIIIQGEQ